LRQLPLVEIDSLEQTWVDLLAATGVVESKSAARRAVRDGGAYLNNGRILDESFVPTTSDLLHGKYLVLRKGKRDLAAVILR
jgi:tyrosyl-tRNA synthetase